MLELYYSILMLRMFQLRSRKTADGRSTISVPMRHFLLNLLEPVKKKIFCNVLSFRASAAPMMGTCDDNTGNEWCVDLLLVLGGGLQIHRYTGRKRDSKWSLTDAIYFQCSTLDAAADTDVNTVPPLRAS